MSARSYEVLPAVHDPARRGVDDEGEDEQHEAGREEGARRLRIVELALAVGDLRGKRLAAAEDRERERAPDARHDQVHRDRLAEGPAEAEHGAADDPGP